MRETRYTGAMTKLPGRGEDIVAFLRRAAAQLRELAEHDPSIAAELRRLARDIEAEADEIEDSDGR